MPVFQGCYYITAVPDIEFRDGAFIICYRISEQARIEIAMPPHTFFRTRREASRAVAQFDSRSDNVQSLCETGDEPDEGAVVAH